MDSGLLGGVLN